MIKRLENYFSTYSTFHFSTKNYKKLYCGRVQNSCHMCDICDFKYLSCEICLEALSFHQGWNGKGRIKFCEYT